MNYFLKEALLMAEQAKLKNDVPVGAVAVYENKVIAKAKNERVLNNDPLAHAELILLKELALFFNNWRFDEVDIYVTLEPCLMCAGAFLQTRVRSVYYGVNDIKGGAFSCFNINKYPFYHFLKFHCLEEPECSIIISDFFKVKRLRK